MRPQTVRKRPRTKVVVVCLIALLGLAWLYLSTQQNDTAAPAPVPTRRSGASSIRQSTTAGEAVLPQPHTAEPAAPPRNLHDGDDHHPDLVIVPAEAEHIPPPPHEGEKPVPSDEKNDTQINGTKKQRRKRTPVPSTTAAPAPTSEHDHETEPEGKHEEPKVEYLDGERITSDPAFVPDPPYKPMLLNGETHPPLPTYGPPLPPRWPPKPPARTTAEGLHWADDSTKFGNFSSFDEQYQDLLALLNRVASLEGSRASGILFSVQGGDRVKDHQVHCNHLKDRLANLVTPIIEKTLQGFPADRTLFVHVTLEDHCPFYNERHDPESEVAQLIRNITVRHQSLYWAHWNPTLMDPDEGTIGERVIPIPHFESMDHDVGASEDVLVYQDRQDGVAWRGTTTGVFPRDYRLSDRWRIVAAFHHVEQSTVKFSSRCQGVNEAVVPDTMMADELSEKSLAMYQVVLDIDGNGNSWEGLRWKLRSGATIVKQKSHRFTQWYYPLLRDEEELYLVDLDSQDIVGLATGLASNEDLVMKLSDSAKAFGDAHLSIEACRKAVADQIEGILEYSVQGSRTKDWRIQGYYPTTN